MFPYVVSNLKLGQNVDKHVCFQSKLKLKGLTRQTVARSNPKPVNQNGSLSPFSYFQP